MFLVRCLKLNNERGKGWGGERDKVPSGRAETLNAAPKQKMM